jgi:hypothetical protein
MKRILKIAALAFVIVLSSPWRNKAAAQPYAEEEVTYQTFYDELSPHGRWVDDPEYGYVWIPNAEANFRPYSSNGHWVYTDDYEWMWVSDYDWGWAPFHYGRWSESPDYGWFWVPGYEWSPAWVAWRDGGDYYGWAPLRPGISISVNFSIGSYSPPYDYWNFAPRRYITSPRIFDHCYDRRQNITIINQTTIINNYNYSRNVFRTGPRRNDVEIYTGRITPVRFRQSTRPGRTIFRNNEVNVYRPDVRRDEDRRFSPRNFERSNRVVRSNDNRFDRNDNRDRRTNNRFERNNNTPGDNNRVRDNNNIGNRSVDNNPGRRQRTNEPFERRNNNEVRQPSDNGNEVRRRDASPRNRDGGNTRPPDDGRMNRRPEPVTNPGNNNGNRQMERRVFDRNSQPQVREPRQPEMREPRQPQVREQRQPQMREQRQPQMREQRQPQVREQRSPQVSERRAEPRQFERRDNGNSSGNGNGRSRGRN